MAFTKHLNGKDYMPDYNRGYVTPYSGQPSTMPGLGSEIFASLLEYKNPESIARIYQFWIDQRKQIMATQKGIQLEINQKHVAAWESEIKRLSDPEFRRNEAIRLLAHRATYIDKLTPEDRDMIEKDNAVLRTYLK